MADHVGVYEVSGALMQTPGTVTGTGELTNEQAVLRATTAVPSQYNSAHNFVSSTVIHSVPPQTSANSIEVNQLNAFFSGTEPIEYFYADHMYTSMVEVPSLSSLPPGCNISFKVVDGINYYTLAIPTAWKDLYYAKYQGIGIANPNSNRLNYNIYKHVVTLEDVFSNIPLTSPSASLLAAPTIPGFISQRATAFKPMIGTVGTISPSGVIVTNWQTYVTGNDIAAYNPVGSYSTTGTFISAMAANLIYIGADATSSVTGVSIGAGPECALTLEFSRPISSLIMVGQAVYLHSWVPLVSEVSGAYLNSTSYNPISIDVPVQNVGTIKNIKAWVEFIHDHRVSSSDEVVNAKRGLKNVQIALRSPNTNFETAHPLWNDHLSFPLRTNVTLTGVSQQFGNDYYNVPSLLQNSYLLWDGHGVEDGLADSLTNGAIGNAYHEFDRDVDMRTIFWDGAPHKNPRDISMLLGDATERNPGVPTHPYSWLASGDGHKNYASPTNGAVEAGAGALLIPGIGFDAPGLLLNVPVSGAQVPWMLDSRLNMCGFENTTARTNLVQLFAASPPGGWTSGRGGLVPWQYTQNDVLTNPDALPPGYGGRVFIRPSTKTMHVLGGNIDTVGNYGSGSWHVKYAVDEAAGTFTLDPNNTGLVLGAEPVTIPTAGVDSSVNYYDISTGNPGIAGGSKERFVLVGGSAASVVHNGVWVGTWDNPASEDISYIQTSVLPSGVTRHYSTIIDDKIYVAGGEKTAGVVFTGVFTGTIDQTTGYVAQWGEKLFPSTTTRLATKVIQIGSYGAMTSLDAGVTFVAANSSPQLVTGSAPSLTVYGAVHTSDSQYFGVAGDYWATTLDDGATWWTGSMTGTQQSAYAICSASSGKVYTAGEAIMKATPPAVFGQSINWVKDVDLIPRTTGVPTQITSWSPSVIAVIDDAENNVSSGFISVQDRNSRVSSQLYLEFLDPVYSRTRRLVATFLYRTNGGPWITISSQEATLSDGESTTLFFNDIEMPDLPNIDVSYLFNFNEISVPTGDSDSYFIVSMNVGQPFRAWRPNTLMKSICTTRYSGYPDLQMLVAVGQSTSTVGSFASNVGMTEWTHSKIGIDGDVFNGVVSSENNVIYGITPTIVAVGGRGGYTLIAYSTNNAVSWTTLPVSYYGELVAVAYGNGLFVAVSFNGYILTSPNGITWTVALSPPVYPSSKQYHDIIWNGTNFVIAATLTVATWHVFGGGYTYSNQGITTYTSNGSTFTMVVNPNASLTRPMYALAQYIGEVPADLGKTHWSFFDAIPDQTGTLQKFGWTTFMDNTSGLMSTFRYKLDPALTEWQLKSDAGIVELVTTDTNHYPPVVDDKHRVWTFDRTLSKYSQLSWDHVNERVNMSPLVVSNFGQSQGNLDVSVSMSIAFASGVMFSLNQGTAIPQVAATAFVGPAPAADEFNTVGAQLGPDSIQPVYPILSDVSVIKVVDTVDNTVATADNPQFTLSSPRVDIIGTRPGLMGTECAGIWNFLFGTKASAFNITTGYSAREESGLWVRQVRLELLTNLRMSTHEQLVSKNKRFEKSSYVISKDGPHRVSIQSGSAAWDAGINYVNVNQVPEYGRAIGITSDVNALPDYAVLTFITGNLYDKLVAEGSTSPSNPSWYLSYPDADVVRPTGIPYIPDSYMLAGTGTAEQVDALASKNLIDNTVGIQTIVPNANTMIDFLNRQGYAKTMIKRWEEAIAAQVSGSSGYFPGLP